MTCSEAYNKVLKMQGYQLSIIWDALERITWEDGEVYDNSDMGITMDEWAETIKSRLDYVNRTHVTAYHCIGWYKNITEMNPSNSSSGTLFIDEEEAKKYANEKMQNFEIRKVEGVLLRDVCDPWNHDER